jgi:hypothetical protein
MSGVATTTRSSAAVYTSVAPSTLRQVKHRGGGVATDTRAGASIGCAVANPKKHTVPRRNASR